MSASQTQASASPVGLRVAGAVAVLLVGVVLGASGSWVLRSTPEAPGIPLKPLRLAAGEVLFPENARVIDSPGTGEVVSWTAPAPGNTRCGQRAEATLLPSRLALPELALCAVHNFFKGGSSDGDCPLTTVCVARRGQTEMVCTSDDESCRAIVKAFVP